MEFNGVVSSNELKGKARVVIDVDAVTIETADRALSLSYADVIELKAMDYAVALATGNETYTISRLGYDTDAFYQQVLAAYNAKVLESLFVSGTPLIEAKGCYSFSAEGRTSLGSAVIQLYERCLVLLPANLDARRIPLCFTTKIEADDFCITYTLDNGDSYTVSRIGYDTEPLEKRSSEQLHSLMERALCQVRALDSSLSEQQAGDAAVLLMEGVAASLGELSAISDTLVAAIEAQIGTSRIANYYQILNEYCDVAEMAFGFREDVGFARCDEQSYLIWLMAPSRDNNVCAVEYAGAQEVAAATFIFEFSGEWDRFRRGLNHAMEAIDFRREVISLSDEELRQPQNERYRMAIERNQSLAYIRSCYRGRVVHRSEESWRKEIAQRLSVRSKAI